MRYSGGQLIAQYKYLGKEPEYENLEIKGSKFTGILNWYSSMMDSDDAKKFISEFIKANDINCNFNPKRVIPTYGWIARIINRGGILNEREGEKLLNYIHSSETIDKTPEEDKENISSRVYNDPLDEIMPVIENFIDSGDDTEINKIDFINMRVRDKKRISETINNEKTEYLLFVKGNDPDINEAYSCYKKTEVKKFINNIDKIINKISLKTNIKVQERERVKIEKKRKKDEQRKLKFFRFLDNDATLGIKSVNPLKIIGSNVVFLLDRRRKLISKLVAEDGKTLDINRTNIINIDKDKSVTKRIGRNLEEYVSKFKLLNQKSKLKFIDELKQTPCHVSGQTSHDNLILGVN